MVILVQVLSRECEQSALLAVRRRPIRRRPIRVMECPFAVCGLGSIIQTS